MWNSRRAITWASTHLDVRSAGTYDSAIGSLINKGGLLMANSRRFALAKMSILLLAVFATLLGLMQPANAALVRPLSTGHEVVLVGLSCDGTGHIKSYNGVMTSGSPNRTVETYFNFRTSSGSVSSGHDESTVKTSSSGSIHTSTHSFFMSVYVAVQFNVYYPYPDDHLYQSDWRGCSGGAAPVKVEVRH